MFFWAYPFHCDMWPYLTLLIREGCGLAVELSCAFWTLILVSSIMVGLDRLLVNLWWPVILIVDLSYFDLLVFRLKGLISNFFVVYYLVSNMHDPVWQYWLRLRLFYCMADEHIPECSSLMTFISCAWCLCSLFILDSLSW